jgi:hypothetical protein
MSVLSQIPFGWVFDAVFIIFGFVAFIAANPFIPGLFTIQMSIQAWFGLLMMMLGFRFVQEDMQGGD